jgi:hypothetical protein
MKKKPTARRFWPSHPSERPSTSDNNLIMVSPTAATIDREWARSLIGLRLKVEACWWPEFSGHELYPGVIEDVDFDDPNDRFFIFRIDGDEWTYNMRYDAVIHYADEDHPSYHTFRLPDGYMQDPTTEEVTLAQLQKQVNTLRQRNVRLHDEDTDDIAFNNADDFSDLESVDDANATIYRRSDEEDWERVTGNTMARQIDPVPFTGSHQEFTPKITPEELESMKDSSGDIRYESVFQWMLPKFTSEAGEQTYFEFIAARMRNYMLHIIAKHSYKPKYLLVVIFLNFAKIHLQKFSRLSSRPTVGLQQNSLLSGLCHY